MEVNQAESIFKQYVSGWRSADFDTVLGTLTKDCVITECYGPIYRGQGMVRLWLEKWLGEGNRVLQWDINSFVLGQEAAAVEWKFKCLWQRAETTFDGASIIQFKNEKIHTMREYATTSQLYEWCGTWK